MKTKNEQIVLGSKKKEAIIWLSVALLVFASLIFSIWLCFEKIKDGADSFFSEKNKIALLGSQSEEIEGFKKKYNNYTSNFQKIDQMFIDPQNPLGFIEFLEGAAFEAGADLEISPLVFSKDAELKILSLQLVSKGNFSDVLNFLRKIESGHYFISMQNLTITESESLKSGDKVAIRTAQASFLIKVLTQ